MSHAADKSLESWIWDAACSIRGAQEAPKFKDFILPLIFTKRLCDVFDDELNRIAVEVGSRAKAFKLVEKDHKLVRFYLPLKPQDPGDAVWSVIRKLTGKIGESLTGYLHDIAKANPPLEGIIDRMDFNATTHGQRDIDDDRLSNLIERISEKRLGLKDVEADIIGRSYEYLIRKFAEGSGQSAGEFFTPPEVARVMVLIMDPDPGMSVYDPCCGSAGLLIACEHVLDEKMLARRLNEGSGGVPSLTRRASSERANEEQLEARRVSEGSPKYAPLRMHGQEYVATTWAMANMNMIIHDMEGSIEIGDTFKNPRFRVGNRLQTFDRVVSNPMWNQDWFKEEDYDADELGRFPQGAGFPGAQSADGGWAQHILASLGSSGRAATTSPFQKLARIFKVSPIAAARRARDLGLIDDARFFGFYQRTQLDWQRQRHERESSGGNFYATQNVRLSKRFARAVVHAVREGRLLYLEAYRLTGLKGDRFEMYANRVLEEMRRPALNKSGQQISMRKEFWR